MKNICFINGSLRGKKASSLEFLKDLNRRLPDEKFNKTFVTVKPGVNDDYSENTYQCFATADAIILAFPLYTYGLTGALMRLLEDYYQYIQTDQGHAKDTKVYVIVNCGFPKPESVTQEALRVIQNFCRRLSLNWRFAVCIGTGPVVALTKKVPFLDLKLKKAYKEIACDITGSSEAVMRDYIIRPLIPETIINMIKHHYEKKMHMIDSN